MPIMSPVALYREPKASHIINGDVARDGALPPLPFRLRFLGFLGFVWLTTGEA
jgi:hypothetical protein